MLMLFLKILEIQNSLLNLTVSFHGGYLLVLWEALTICPVSSFDIFSVQYASIIPENYLLGYILVTDSTSE